MNLLYNTSCLVLPCLQYCITVWGSAYPSFVTPLFILEKRVIKICNRLPMNTPSLSLFQSPKCLSLYQLYYFFMCMFMYKYQNNTLPSIFHNHSVINSSTHRYDTQNSLHNRIPKFTTKKCLRCTLYFDFKIWNLLPSEITNSFSIKISNPKS